MRKGLPGIPFSLVSFVDPLMWLESVGERAKLLEEMRPGMSERTKTRLKEARTLAGMLSRADMTERERTLVAAGLKAMQAAWLAEIELGAKPRIERAVDGQKQKEKASGSAAGQRAENAGLRHKLIRKLAQEAPAKAKVSGEGLARHVKHKAGALKSPVGEEVAGLSTRRIKDIINQK